MLIDRCALRMRGRRQRPTGKIVVFEPIFFFRLRRRIRIPSRVYLAGKRLGNGGGMPRVTPGRSNE